MPLDIVGMSPEQIVKFRDTGIIGGRDGGGEAGRTFNDATPWRILSSSGDVLHAIDVV